MINRITPLLLIIGLAFWSCEEDFPKDCAGISNGDNICGCTDSTATNYNSIATHDDGSCEDCAGIAGGDNVCGCTDSTATNYNSIATHDDGSCEDCAGIAGGDNVCGCTDSTATNFDPDASVDDGSCFFQCESNYTYINDLPGSVAILAGGDSCFFNNDLIALNDIITSNQLSYETPLHLGTQTWFNGRLRFLVAGHYWGGVESPLSVLPESIGNLDDLMSLYLEWNHLSSLPESFYQLTNLMSLYISNNQLESISDGIGNMTDLFFLDLGYNQISSIPDSFCNLENLTYWWMFNNELDQLPDCICSLNINWNDDDAANYPYFAIGGNNLCENIPDCIANSENFDISLDQFYYTWPVVDTQNCDGLYNSNGFINPRDFNLSQP